MGNQDFFAGARWATNWPSKRNRSVSIVQMLHCYNPIRAFSLRTVELWANERRRKLAGADGIRLLHDQLLSKPPDVGQASHIGWHQDLGATGPASTTS